VFSLSKKNGERSEHDLPLKKNGERSANSILRKVTKGYRLSFFGIFFFSFRRIKEKIKEKIEKDNKE
jgi:hypothetical protein